MATYAVLREGRDGEALDELDRSLGFEVDDEDEVEMPEHGSTYANVIMGDFGQGGDVITVA
jgi:hypothetical protein